MKNQGYQCISEDNEAYFLPLNKGDDLHCVTPSDLEVFLKACRDYKNVLYPLDNNNPRIDNDLCMMKNDLKRLIQRCD